jgi:hypothetical protein
MLDPLPPRPPRPFRAWLSTGPGVAASGAVLSLFSLWLVYYAADAEPFFFFTWFDAALFYGATPALILAWLAWTALCLVTLGGVSRRRRWFAIPPIMLWVLLNLLQLGFCVFGYYGDTHRFASLLH